MRGVNPIEEFPSAMAALRERQSKPGSYLGFAILRPYEQPMGLNSQLGNFQLFE